MGVKTAVAGPGTISNQLALSGEVHLNEDRTAHVVPRLTGVVKDVLKSAGDTVSSGDALAVLDSRELADAKADFLAAHARLGLAEQLFRREDDLWKKKISAEQDYLRAKQALEEARIATRTSEQKIHALGISDRGVKSIHMEDEANLTRFAVTAPFDGTIIQKHITLGEFLEANADVFLIADLSSVWVDINVNKKDLPRVKAGQQVTISAQDGIPPVTGAIAFVAPVVGSETRTTTARVILPNPDGLWRPGLFINATIDVDRNDAPVVIDKKAIVTIEEQPRVFVKNGEGFIAKPVQTGLTDGTRIEVVSGLGAGDVYASEGAYTLKAEMEKSELAEEGHAH
jgi:cobalt-zinc-cadmium efflux system membrane fusion protein